MRKKWPCISGNALTVTSGRFRTWCRLTRLSVARVYPHATRDSFHPLIFVRMQLSSSTHLKISTAWLSLPTLSPATCSLIHFSLLSLINPPQPSMVPTWETSTQCGAFPHLPPQPKLEHAIGGSMEAASSTHLEPDVRPPP